MDSFSCIDDLSCGPFLCYQTFQFLPLFCFFKCFNGQLSCQNDFLFIWFVLCFLIEIWQFHSGGFSNSFMFLWSRKLLRCCSIMSRLRISIMFSFQSENFIFLFRKKFRNVQSWILGFLWRGGNNLFPLKSSPRFLDEQSSVQCFQMWAGSATLSESWSISQIM